jgi:hypothetical protein
MKFLVLRFCHGFGISIIAVVGAVSVSAQTASSFYAFKGGSNGDGEQPTVLIQAQDGNFYGITAYGGNATGCTDDQGNTTGCGTIFRISTSGSETVLYKFSGAVGGTAPTADGGIPSSLIQGPDGNLYGTTLIGGLAQSPSLSCVDSSGATAPCCVDSSDPPNAVGCGTIFEFSPTQAASITPKILYTFSGTTDGGSPGNLTLGAASSGTPVIYGSTLSCSNCHFTESSGDFDPNGGSIFSFTPPASAGSTVTISPIVTFSTDTAAFPKLGSNANLAFPNSLIQWDQTTLYGTTQMGGSTDTGGNAVCQSEFGCGGAFRLELATTTSSTPTLLDLCNFGDLIDAPASPAPSCSSAVMPQSASQAEPASRPGKPSPQTIVAQSGRRFPTGGTPWGFSVLPIALAMDSNGNIYGTTPPGCVDSNYALPYTPDSNCAADHATDFSNGEVDSVQSTIFQLSPPSETSNSAGDLSFLYTFSGNGSSATTPPSDGGGAIAGLTLATDSNLYGLSGNGASSFYGLSGTAALSSELFELPAQNGSLPNPVQSGGLPISLGFSYSPNWMIEGSDGNFYGTSSTAIPTFSCGYLCVYFGSIFEVAPSPSLNPPVELSFNSPQINLNSSATLTWTVPNAFSLTSQQCYAFVESAANATTAGENWTSPLSGAVADSAFTGSTTIKPTAAGTYVFAVTCGGTVTGSAMLVVVTAPTVTVAPATSSITTTQPLNVMVAVAGTPTPTGTVTLSGGNYTSAVTALSSGSATITIPADTLAAGSYTFTATYTPDSGSSSTYGSASGTASSPVTVSVATPTVTVTPGASGIGTTQPLSVAVAVSGGSGSPTPTGSVTLSGGGYTSSAVPLSSGNATFNIAGGTLSTGSYTFEAAYAPDTNSSSTYGSASGTASTTVSVTTPTYAMSATALSVAPGGSGSSTITVNSSNGYAGTITLSCSVTAQPAGATDIPTCTGNQLTMNSTATSGTVAVTINTTAATAKLERPDQKTGGSWRGFGGAAFAIVVLMWGPWRSRRWIAILGVLIGCLLAANLTACGGGNSNGPTQTSNPGTTAGSYTITINATGNDASKTTATTSFTLTVT